MTIRVDDDVLRTWDEKLAGGLDSAITVRLTPTTPVGDALHALDVVVREVVEEPQVEGAPFRGEWSWVRSGSDVLVTVLECSVPDEVLPPVVAGLEERGVDGELTLYEEEAGTPAWTAPARLVEVRMRPRGRREQAAGRHRWLPDVERVERVLDVALDWCARDARSGLWLMTGVNPDVEVAPHEAGGRVREALRASAGPVEVRTATRGVVTDLSTGRVALIETGIPWRRTLAAAVEVLRSAEADLAYGFVKSGSSPLYVTQGESLRFDWPPRPDVDADRVRRGAVYEDTHAPDAFAVQLLGPGYAERVPDAPPYEATPVGESTLLEHADLAAWFEAPFVPPDVRWNQIRDVTPPLVLAEARVALAPILFRPPE